MSGQTNQTPVAVQAASQPVAQTPAPVTATVAPVVSAPVASAPEPQVDESARALACMKAQQACPAMAENLQKDFMEGKSAEYFAGVMAGFTNGKANNVITKAQGENPPEIGGSENNVQPKAGAQKTYGMTGQVARMGK